MGRIPVITSQIAARRGEPSGTLIGTRASGADFGAGVGQAMQTLAGGVDDVSAGLFRLEEQRRQEDVANRVAQSDFTPRELAIRNTTPANGQGYHKSVTDEYRSFVDTEADRIDDPVARREYKSRMLAQLPNVSSRSAQYEFTLAATSAKEQANASLDALGNKISSDPTMYETYVAQGNDVIDANGSITPTLKEGMKNIWRQNSAKSRFNGMLENVKSVEEIDAISAELTGVGADAAPPDERPKDWTKEFAPEDFDRMINTIGNVRKAFITKADADARAAIESIEARAADVSTLLPQEELAAVQRVVKQSQNPVTLARMARITRDQDLIREERMLPPRELRARQNATNGNPDIAFPGLPPTLSNAVNEATQKFDVSASYLGSTAQKEYGKYLKTNARGKPEFAPTSVHAGVDLRNVNSQVLDAAAVAGELFGRPLPITSGYRSQARQDEIRASGDPNRPTVAKKSGHTERDALDISTVGMSEDDKAKMVGSLVDAGFTGIGQYDTHIHADFREAVPASFGNKPGWGGWTYLSEPVMQALQERGFAAGLSRDKLQRRGAFVPQGDDIDYGRATDMVKDDGRPASSAVGVYQIVDGTFLETIRKPGVAAKIGVDITNASDDQVLAMRKDPRVNTMVAAAYAEQNKRTLQQTLGRTVSDAELYAAHFLGPGGATALLVGVSKQPEQSAAALLPDAARANKAVFYQNGKPLTVQQVYNRIIGQFTNAPTSVAFGDNQTRQRMIDNADKQIAADPMRYASQSGTFNISDLNDAGGYAQRGAEARAVADYYSIPMEQIKPFTDEEANALKKQMVDGTVDDVLGVMAQIQAMGGDVTTAALRQLEQKDSVYAFAAGLYAERGQGAVASDVVRGQKRIEENPAIKDSIGAQDRDISDAFVRATGGALYEISPRQRQAIQDAAFAHYVETVAARGTSSAFDEAAFSNSVQAVLGGTQGKQAVDEVNGQATVMPPGVSGDEMESAFTRMTTDDWARLSEQKVPPRYVTGDLISPDDLADEATLRAIGGNKYKVMMSDGSFAVTGALGPNGRLEAYIFTPTEKEIQQLNTRPVAAPYAGETQERGDLQNSDGVQTLDEQQRVRAQYGALYQFDEYGRWIGPAGEQK